MKKLPIGPFSEIRSHFMVSIHVRDMQTLDFSIQQDIIQFKVAVDRHTGHQKRRV